MNMYRHAPKIERSKERPNKSGSVKRRSSRRPTAKAAKPSEVNKRKAPSKPAKRIAWRRIVRLTLSVVSACVLIAGGAFTLHALLTSPRLTVKTVEITGNDRALEETLLAYGGLRAGQSIFEMSLDETARNLRRHPWVADATVTRAFPDRVVVRIVEEEPAALVSLGGLYLANAEGKLFKRWAPSDPRNLPLITGLRREDTVAEDGGLAERIADGIDLGLELSHWRAQLGEVEELNFDEALGWSVVARTSSSHTVRLTLGLEPRDRISTAARTLSELNRRELVASVIRVDGKKRPGRVHVSLSRSPNFQMEEASE